jgi:hypothetical protein
MSAAVKFKEYSKPFKDALRQRLSSTIAPQTNLLGISMRKQHIERDLIRVPVRIW